MIEMAKLIDRANTLGADITIWSKRAALKHERWEVRVHRDRDLRVMHFGASLIAACAAVLDELDGLE